MNMNIKHLVKYSLSVAALAVAAIAVPAHADVFLDFKVTQANTTFTADKISGSYTELFTVTGANTFSTSAYSKLTGFLSNDGTVTLSPNNINATYGLYATFTATGNILNGGANFEGTSGVVKLYKDNFTNASEVTGLALPTIGGAEILRTNAGDDNLLASTSTLLFGSGHNYPGGTTAANGDFSLTFDNFLLTSFGKDYFSSPNPFFEQFTIDGNFSSFSVPTTGSSIITGANNVFFVPEPDMVALFGIALLGFGFSRRRSAK
jgi:hypothetical protein